MCYDPNGAEGVCKSIKQCPAVLTDTITLLESQDTALIQYIQRSNTICGGRKPFVCCPFRYKSVKQTKFSPDIINSNSLRPKHHPDFRLSHESCRDPNGEHGFCRSIRECPVILKDFTALLERKDVAFIQYIQQSNAICSKTKPVICCPARKKSFKPSQEIIPTNRRIQHLLTPDEGCGFSNVSNLRSIGYRSRAGSVKQMFYLNKVMLMQKSCPKSAAVEFF